MFIFVSVSLFQVFQIEKAIETAKSLQTIISAENNAISQSERSVEDVLLVRARKVASVKSRLVWVLDLIGWKDDNRALIGYCTWRLR